MKFFFVLLFVVASQQFCFAAARIRLFGPLDMMRRLMHNYKGIPDFDDLLYDEERQVYSYEQTIVVRDAGPNDKVRRCQVIEVYKKDDAAKARRELKLKLSLEVQEVNMERMMFLLADCDSVDEWELDDTPDLSKSLAKGIFPGTKWCGVGDIANGYHDLGEFRNVDRCCRAHDLCPIKILVKDTRYNLTNISHYTKSHCSCDVVFYDCLKDEDGPLAQTLGNLYFYTASPQCIEVAPENSGERMKFIPTPNKW